MAIATVLTGVTTPVSTPRASARTTEAVTSEPVEADPTAQDQQLGDFSRFVAQHGRQLTGFARLVAGNPTDADDLVQTALAKAFLRWQRISADDFDTLAYIRRIIVNEHRSLWRRAFHRHEVVTDEPPEHGTTDADPVDETWERVLALPPRQRAVIALRFYSDMSVADTATVLRCSEGTVKSQTSRALDTLREGILAERGEA